MASERRQFARGLRKQMTRAEEILWAQLRGSRFHGAKFRRQVPLDRYVVDFYCHASKLVVDPRTAIRGTAGNMNGSPNTTPVGPKSSKASEFESCASPMPRSLTSSIPC